MPELQVGDEVRTTFTADGLPLEDSLGRIVEINFTYPFPYQVRFASTSNVQSFQGNELRSADSEPKEELKVKQEKMVVSRNLFTLRVKRNKAGVEVYVKSPRLETFFQNLGGELCSTYDFPGIDYCYPRLDIDAALRKGTWTTVNLEPHRKLLHDGLANVSWMRLKGLGAGICWRIEMPMTRTLIKHFVDQVNVFMTEFYREYIKPLSYEVRMTSWE